jgi:ubiquinone/menaquinone biosynthesis C-methylase UbiE
MLGWLWEKRARRFASLHLPFLTRGERVLDVGAGNCRVARLLEGCGIPTTPVDISDYNATDLPLRLYDGKRLPFGNASFDVVMLNSVLHHCDDPGEVLREAIRVSRSRLQIVEDLYANWTDLQLLKFNDWISNAPFNHACPFKFQSDKGWKKTWESLNLQVVAESNLRGLLGLAKFRLYVLNKRP